MILKHIKRFVRRAKRHPALYKPPLTVRYDMVAVEKSFARLFATEDGQKVLAYLQSVTFMRAAAADAEEGLLRHSEGQRALLAMIMRLAARGQSYHP